MILTNALRLPAPAQATYINQTYLVMVPASHIGFLLLVRCSDVETHDWLDLLPPLLMLLLQTIADLIKSVILLPFFICV